MLTGYLGIGFLAGFALFCGKFIVYKMIMGVFPKGVSRWVYNTPIAMVFLDFGFAGLAAPIAGMAGGTIAMLTMITFTTLSAMYLGGIIIYKKVKKGCQGMFTVRETYQMR